MVLGYFTKDNMSFHCLNNIYTNTNKAVFQTALFVLFLLTKTLQQ